MDFEWDDNKRAEVMARRGVDFREAALIFEGPTLTRPDNRREYGEPRWISVGEADGTCFVVVHTPRGASVRIISAWKGGRRDRREYQASLFGGAAPDEGQG